MADKQPEEKDDFIELVKKLWSPIIGIIGAVTSLFNFYQLWSGNQATIIYILAGGGFLLLLNALAWVGFSKKDIPKRGNRKALRSVPRYNLLYRRIAWSGLGILTLLATFGVYFLMQHRTEQEKKLIVLITAFEGPEEVYGLRNEIVENLNADFSADENIEIIPIDEVITVSNGSEYARKLGENFMADMVIWGWYRPTENPNINIHIENLSPAQLLPLNESEIFQPTITISELESFSFQQQTGNETSALISFLAGLIEFQSENYETAIKYFNNSLAVLPESPLMFENQIEIYYFRGNSNIFVKKYEDAIRDLGQAIQIDPEYEEAYSSRGLAYYYLDEYELAIQDYDQAIQINPQNAETYFNRGFAYQNLDEYEKSIQDCDQAIQINPQYASAYVACGLAYHYLGEYKLAIQDYDQAISINPQYAAAYAARALAYYYLGEYEHATQDCGQAIQINPQYESGYIACGLVYYELGKYELAIQNYDQVIQIDPQHANTYYNRGLAYQELGKTAEAEADFAKYKELTGRDAP